PEVTSAAVTPQVSVTDQTATTVSMRLDGEPFTAGSVVDAEGTHTLAVTATDAVSWTATKNVTFTIDRTAPSLVFRENGQLVTTSLTRHKDVAIDIAATDVHGVATSSATLNGAPYNSGTPITADGTHLLVASAIDRAGNAATAQLTIVIDKSKPAVSITDVPEITKAAVTPRITTTAGTLAATLNGNPFAIGSTIDAEGEYTLVATATDDRGNTSSASVTFIIDRTAPTVTLTDAGENVSSSIARNRDVAIVVAASDAHGVASLTSTLDGAAYTSGTIISSERMHALLVRAVDRAGNEATAELSILVDKTAPVVTIDAIAELTKEHVTPRITATEGTLAVTLNGSAYVIGTPIDAEREHTLVATATDAVGNSGSATAIFTIDRTPPSISFTEAGEAVAGSLTRNRDVAIAIAANDASGIASVQSTLDGAAYTSGTAISSEGTHSLAVRAVDRAGNEATAQLSILIDKSGPVVAIHDVPALTKNNVTPRIVASEGTISATLNGAPFTPGATIDLEREHTLVATVTDAVGNTGSATATFTIDRTPPALSLTEAGQIVSGSIGRNRDIAIAVAASDAHGVASLNATLDGAAYASGTSIASEGT
ncbi:MAG TPA: Ig-like domain-containing protein, partial [Thermoanaerobaculia bacterium]|nr:Ig-like domain-containing protein [Thermoanaerobaculia bacterium]